MTEKQGGEGGGGGELELGETRGVPAPPPSKIKLPPVWQASCAQSHQTSSLLLESGMLAAQQRRIEGMLPLLPRPPGHENLTLSDIKSGSAAEERRPENQLYASVHTSTAEHSHCHHTHLGYIDYVL